MQVKLTALFLRRLAEEIVPQNKLYDLIQDLKMSRDHALEPFDFTSRELEMSAAIGPTEEEIDLACEVRIGQYKKAFDAERKRADALSSYLRAAQDRLQSFEREVYLLHEAFKALGVIAPESQEPAGG